jgi:hypothetical protein
VAIPLGVDAARATFGLVREVASRIDPVGLLPSLLAQLVPDRGSAPPDTDGGVDLLAALRRLLRR